MPAVNRVLRSVFIDPEMDNFLREMSSNLNITQSDLMTEYLVRGARLQLEEAMAADPRSPEGRAAATSVVRLARVAKILPVGPASKNIKPQNKTVNKASGKPTKAVAKTTTAQKVVKTTGSRTTNKAAPRRALTKKR